mmetsp:Transcript_114011/g.333195  ORF Transcript_114011/g.333195 Transcript_114011/m.333195 type:complete len:308 (-) Transcript_114011:38-961(-)
MRKLPLWLLCALLPAAAALRRGPPEDVDLDRDALAAAAMSDFDNLEAFFSQSNVSEILEEMKNISVGFLKTWGNVTLPTERDLPRAVPQRCAIVASGRSVLNATAGEDIDAVDGPVLRLNFPSTQRYEAFVGNRTDALLINDQGPCHWKNRGPGPFAEVKMLVINNFGHKRGAECMPYLQERYPAVPAYVLDFDRMNKGLQRLTSKVFEMAPLSLSRALTSTAWSTTGMIGGLFLMNMCREVLHYGFLESASCQQHYWDRSKKCTQDRMHNLTKEHVLWKVISSTAGVNFTGEGLVRGWPRLQSSTG